MDMEQLTPEVVLAAFLAKQGPGYTITKADLVWHSGIIPPAEPAPRAAFDSFDFAFMSFVERLKDELLLVHDRELLNVRGIGYRVQGAAEQIETASDGLAKGLRKLFRDTKQSYTHVRVDELSQAERKRRTDEQAKLGSIRLFCRKTLRGK
jgi:hypothetical protein